VGLDDAYQITWLVRRLFRTMAARADAYLQSADLTAADRAVMEFLYPDESLSVPGIAERYEVSRQHVQVTVNGLLQRKLLRSATNPKHKRSPLFRLTGVGREQFAEIRANETTLLEQAFAGIDDSELDATRQTLHTLIERLK